MPPKKRGDLRGGSEVLILSYQKVTGTLNPGAHPGSYNGQDAYSDMLVVDDGSGKHRERTAQSNQHEPTVQYTGHHARPAGDSHRGGNGMSEPIMMSDRKGHNGISEDGTATTLTAQEKERPIIGQSIVRRLTPDECASLQGFPRNWCNIGDWTDTKGKTHKEADSPKYKAYGNSIAVGFANERSGFWCWLMRRIAAQYERKATQGSLFSGIGGFDLAWAAVNGPESVRWSSEIEEFPIAVLKTHFGDEDAGIEGDFYQAINGG